MTRLNIKIKGRLSPLGRTHCPRRRAYYVTLREKQCLGKGQEQLSEKKLTLDRTFRDQLKGRERVSVLWMGSCG